MTTQSISFEIELYVATNCICYLVELCRIPAISTSLRRRPTQLEYYQDASDISHLYAVCYSYGDYLSGEKEYDEKMLPLLRII